MLNHLFAFCTELQIEMQNFHDISVLNFPGGVENEGMGYFKFLDQPENHRVVYLMGKMKRDKSCMK